MLTMPVLDDKSYSRILNESLAMIPSLTDKWTDFNPQDTGVMLLELLAGMTEMQNFYLDQVGDRFYQKLLAPLLDADSEQPADKLFQSFETERTMLRRAVTAEDYQMILVKQHCQDFGVDDARVQIDGKHVHISVCRKAKPLSPDELDKIRLCLEKYRLLTVRIFVEQSNMQTGGGDGDG